MQHRKPRRLPTYDYARTGMYFVTICIQGRKRLLGHVEGDSTRPSRCGEIVTTEIHRLENRFNGVGVDLAIVMPDHAHVIVILEQQSRKLGTIVGSLKATTAREINRQLGRTGAPVWQRGYYEHVIRDEADLDRIREYIVTNPIRWSVREKAS